MLEGTGGGQVVSATGSIACGTQCETIVADGSDIELTAQPNDASRFAGWKSGAEACGLGVQCTLHVSAATDAIANFEAIPDHRLTVSMTGNGIGNVKSTPTAEIDCGTHCTATLREGTMITLDAEPQPGSQFLGWSGVPGCGSMGMCRLQLGADAAVGARFDRDGTAEWLTAMGGDGEDYGKFIDYDAAGNMFVAGTFFSPVMQIGPFEFSNKDPLSDGPSGSTDVFLAKFSADGQQILWARALSGPAFDDVTGMAIRADGDIILSGTFEESIALDNDHTLTGRPEPDRNLFVARLDGMSGATRWAKRVLLKVGDPRPRFPVVSTSDGDVVLGGTNYDTLAFEDLPPVAKNGTYDAFVYRLSGETGDVVWLTVPTYLQPSDESTIANISLNPAGSIVALGSCWGTMRFDDLSQVQETCVDGAGDPQSFLVVLDATTGAALRSRSFGVTGREDCFALSVSDGGSIAVGCGFATGQDVVVDFGGGPVPSPPGAFGPEMVVARYEPTLEYGWAKWIGGDGYDLLAGIGWQRGENPQMVVVGDFGGTLVLDGRSFTSADGSDSIVATLDFGDGHTSWVEQFASALSAPEGGQVLRVDRALNQLLVTGTFMYSVEIGFKNVMSIHPILPEVFAGFLLLPPP
jgi:hypothetical protein